jgi:hypothetical protein
VIWVNLLPEKLDWSVLGSNMISAMSFHANDPEGMSRSVAMRTKDQASLPNFRSAAAILFEMQVEQFKHDELYHREIARLTVKERLTHMALHFAKYVGYLSHIDSDDRLNRVIVDTFIIALSSANTLNFKVAERLPVNAADFSSLRELGSALENSGTSGRDSTSMLRALARPVGHMAKACEAMDHIEAFPFREEISAAVVEIFSFALVAASQSEIDIVNETRSRLRKVKEKSIFHDAL